MNSAALVRCYSALSPTNPTEIHPFPTDGWLANQGNQRTLIRLLMPRNDGQEEDHHHGGGRHWKLLFWKRVIRAIESAYIADPRLKEEHEIEEDILTYYIALQQQQPPSSCTPTAIHTYYYGNPDDRDAWAQIRLCENTASISQGTTGLRTWGASVCLANHLILNRAALLHDHAVSVMELGSGTGLVGLVAHQLNPANRVCLTDCNPVVLDRLEANVLLNFPQSSSTHKPRLSVCHLDWTESAPPPLDDSSPSTLVLGADVIYDPDLVPGLVSTIKQSLRSSSATSQQSSPALAPSAQGTQGNQGSTRSQALICAIVRTRSTWETFLTVCAQEGLQVHFLDVRPAIAMAEPVGAGIVFPQALDGCLSHTHDLLQLVRLTVL
ncbi:hypothetical protein PCANC_25222 [Puccinia coronata f. sp. avenae]|uniref:FAM86 N-terminal domain-containing protein n=1 Tax=Puccinia coronata f. sp. avenae TaxID=200324 RepID=A0A2N5TKF1_9BASI|nr:hypothetical protein PCANC_25222 [Puccinia coronata f. sp. avenae]